MPRNQQERVDVKKGSDGLENSVAKARDMIRQEEILAQQEQMEAKRLQEELRKA